MYQRPPWSAQPGVQVKRPLERGYLASLEIQKATWQQAMQLGGYSPTSGVLLLSQPLFSFPSIREATLCLLFEDLQLQKVALVPAPLMAYAAATADLEAQVGVGDGWRPPVV